MEQIEIIAKNTIILAFSHCQSLENVRIIAFIPYKISYNDWTPTLNL